MAPTRPSCLICETVEGKYKCPRCNGYTCSVPCFRDHRDNHPTVEDPEPPKPLETDDTSGSALADQQDDSETQPLSIADTQEYKNLVRRYPGLPAQLLKIANATDPPASDDHGSVRGSYSSRRNANEPWTKEAGLENGAIVLEQEKETPGDIRDAIQEFSELHRLFKAGMLSGVAAPEALGTPERYAPDDAQTIKRLMREEEASGP